MNMQTSQEYFTTTVYAKFGGQTECIMDNWKIVNDNSTEEVPATLESQVRNELYILAIIAFFFVLFFFSGMKK